ncbi:cytochrome c3 family protein [Rhodobium orientis]|uniref:cytochrome c3 family protein n=1 Tax=Rhodobium orientis TaxID=34017 RepID=UPI001611A367|nr:cytochrome c3 family protein [Rhodobium orientis]
MKRGLPALVVALATVAVLVAAGATGARAGGVPLPEPAKGAGSACVADTAFMRRYHMQMLVHQRRDTVHEGIRTKQFSLKGCIDCHQVKGEDGAPVKVSDGRHFCRSCHDYAAVSIDCFECHASVPEEADQSAAAPDAENEAVAALGAYVHERKTGEGAVK